jgi:hypothetical protein
VFAQTRWDWQTREARLDIRRAARVHANWWSLNSGAPRSPTGTEASVTDIAGCVESTINWYTSHQPASPTGMVPNFEQSHLNGSHIKLHVLIARSWRFHRNNQPARAPRHTEREGSPSRIYRQTLRAGDPITPITRIENARDLCVGCRRGGSWLKCNRLHYTSRRRKLEIRYSESVIIVRHRKQRTQTAPPSRYTDTGTCCPRSS